MKELSTEVINIDGVDYTLFLNRTGVVAFEKYSKKELGDMQEVSKKYQDIDVENSNIDFEKLNDDTNPFEGLDNIDDMADDMQKLSNVFKRLYWIMLYTNHHLTISEASNLYDKACEEYGAEQLVLLGQQMIEDVNKAPASELKNLTALKPRKN